MSDLQSMSNEEINAKMLHDLVYNRIDPECFNQLYGEVLQIMNEHPPALTPADCEKITVSHTGHPPAWRDAKTQSVLEGLVKAVRQFLKEYSYDAKTFVTFKRLRDLILALDLDAFPAITEMPIPTLPPSPVKGEE
jgi:hypothetical protein